MDDSFVKPLAAWYESCRRDLPWRKTKDPYRIWVSEIMLQQTRVEAVIPYYERFLGELPDIRSLALCEEERLLKLWEGLGYYHRALNMKRAAEVITRDFGGVFPDDMESVSLLPGIGHYTAGAVCSIAFGMPVPAVDGNVMRVWARIVGCEDNILEAGVRKRAEADMTGVLEQCCVIRKETTPGELNQALMELGALICIPNGSPRCESCPVCGMCRAEMSGSTDRIPRREKKQKRKIRKLTVLLLDDGEGTAVRKREAGGLLPGLYEFPNLEGHVSEKEAVAFAAREGYDTIYARSLKGARHIFTHVIWDMTGYEMKVRRRDPADNGWIFAEPGKLRSELPVASAFAAYSAHVFQKTGKSRTEDEDTDSCDPLL